MVQSCLQKNKFPSKTSRKMALLRQSIIMNASCSLFDEDLEIILQNDQIMKYEMKVDTVHSCLHDLK
jgi:hypothetical protein